MLKTSAQILRVDWNARFFVLKTPGLKSPKSKPVLGSYETQLVLHFVIISLKMRSMVLTQVRTGLLTTGYL
jgi:hypothetical protein